MLVALLVCLIPTTIGALLSAIGIAGMDRLVQRNVLAMSRPRRRGGGRLLDAAARQDRHDHARQPPGGRVPARCPASTEHELADAAQLVEPRRRDARGALDRRARQGALRRCASASSHGATLVPFTAQTRMSGVDLDGRAIRKGAADSVRRWVEEQRRHRPGRARRRSSTAIAGRGGTPLVVAEKRPACARRRPPEGRRQGGHARALRRAAARWASAP